MKQANFAAFEFLDSGLVTRKLGLRHRLMEICSASFAHHDAGGKRKRARWQGGILDAFQERIKGGDGDIATGLLHGG